MFGRLEAASSAAEEAAEVARLLGSGHQLVFALAQQCLAASWSGADQAAIAPGRGGRADRRYGNGEWSGTHAHYALAVALINAGRREAGRDAMARAAAAAGCSTGAACCRSCELHGRAGGRMRQSRRRQAAGPIAPPSSPTPARKRPRLARAHVLRDATQVPPPLARRRRRSSLTAAGQLIDAGRAGLCAGVAWAAAGDKPRPAPSSPRPRETFADCGARSLSRRHGPPAAQARRPGAGTGRAAGAYGLTQRELEVVKLVGEGYTNQQIAESLLRHRPDRGDPPVAHLRQARRHHPDRHP